MHKVWDVAWLYLVQTYKDRSTLLYGFALPLIFTAVIGAGISGIGGGDDSGPSALRLAIADNDGGAMAQQLQARLDGDRTLEVTLLDAAGAAEQQEAGDVAATLTIPSEFTADLEAGVAITLELHTSRANPTDAQIVEQAVRAALSDVGSAIQIAESSVRVADAVGLFDLPDAPTRQDYYREALELASEATRPVSVTTSQLTRREEPQAVVPSGFQQTSPGIGVMFTMFFITYGGASILLEREQGTLRRLLTMPISKTAIMAGKVLGVFIAGAVQFGILVLAGQFLFGVDWGVDPLALLVMIVSFVFCITSFGILLAALARTYAQVDALSTLIIMPLAGLGGAMWPIEIVPAWMQQLALFLPSGWAMRGFHDIITRGLGLQDILLEAAVLLAFGITFLAIGVWRFKYE